MTPATGPQGSGLAPYAANPRDPGVRLHPEPDTPYRTPFQRDRDRLIHSGAFRRLAQKTQVLAPQEGEVHRTRLTHTLEVAQIARSLARTLRLDEDLAEALALSHDLGHGPFGHTGEEALAEALAPWGGFDHNVQSLRIVVDLELRYLDFDGLNLTWTTLEGIAKHNGPCHDPSALLLAYDAALGLDLGLFSGAEAQVAAIADDIAYNAHDLEDALNAGFFSRDDILEVPVLRELRGSIERGRPHLDEARLPFALARGMIDLFVTDVIAEATRRLALAAPPDIAALRRLGHAVVGLSPTAAEAERAVKSFLFARMYRHPRLASVRGRAKALVARVIEALLADPDRMPAAWAARARAGEPPRAVADYVAGLTDRQAMMEYERLFDAPVDFV